MSLYHFAKLFKISTELSPYQCVLRRRIEKATELLSEPEISVLEANARVGFSDQKHFTKVFQRKTDVNTERLARNAMMPSWCLG